jgi:integrase
MSVGSSGSRRRVRVERGIYRERSGKYTVCFMLDGKPAFRTVGYDLCAARRERTAFMEAARWGAVAAAPEMRFGLIAGWWLERYQRRVAAGERRERTLDDHRYQLEHHLLPVFGERLLREITPQEVCSLIDDLREARRSEHTIASALGTLQSVMRFAVRNGWVPDSPVDKLEHDERPHPTPRTQRVLGRNEIARLLEACLPAYRVLIATAVYTGMRHSELLGLIWDDVNLDGDAIHVRAQLSRAHRGRPAERVRPKTRAGARQIPLSPQLAAVLREHRKSSKFKTATDWVFVTSNGTPLGHRNVYRSALVRAAHAAGLNQDDSRLRLHDLRHTFASHLIIDVGLDVVQVSRILGHSSVSTTLDIYAHLFEEARHTADIRARMSRSEFARLLDTNNDPNVVILPAAAKSPAGRLSARERAAIRCGT